MFLNIRTANTFGEIFFSFFCLLNFLRIYVRFLSDLSNCFYNFFDFFVNKFCNFYIFSLSLFVRFNFRESFIKIVKFNNNKFNYCKNFVDVIVEQQY